MAVSLSDHIRLAELSLTALETISSLASKSGALSPGDASILGLIARIAGAVLSGMDGSSKVIDVEARIKQLAIEIVNENAAIDSALDAKFRG